MGAIIKPEPRLVEVTSVPVIYCDKVGKVTVEGNNVRVTYVEFRTLGAERVMMPVLEMVRPLTSIKTGDLVEMIQRAVGMPVSMNGQAAH